MTVPDGLSELLEEFAVTVLREKPRDLLEFAATYFTELNMSKLRWEVLRVSVKSCIADARQTKTTILSGNLAFYTQARHTTAKRLRKTKRS